MSWEYKTLDQLGEVSRGRSKHRPRNDQSLFGGKYPFIQTADVKAANFYITEYDTTYNEKGLAQSKLWHPGTLCITIAANIADTGILAMDACFPDSVMGFVPYEGIADVRFVKYSFDILQQNCKKISQGAAQDNLSWEKLSTIQFPAPPIEVQTKIADILSAYDDLIENNQEQIKLLEESAQRLYKEWFVDLRFPGHETTPIVDGVPEGWFTAAVTDLLEIRYGKDHKALEDGGIPAYGSGGIMRRVNKALYTGESVLIPRKGSLNNILLVRGNFWTIDTMFYSIPKRPNIAKYAYLFLSGVDMYAMNIGAAVPSMTVKILDGMKLLCPTNQILESFEESAGSYFDMIELLKNKNALLVEARDKLLPKLMNGEIEV